MKVCIVGGDIDSERPSGVIRKIYAEFSVAHDVTMFNGILPKDIKGFDLILWFPNISNEKEKDYPKKDKGAILICSKLMHDDVSEADAVSRIFRMQGNAVVAFYKGMISSPGRILMKTIDALGNSWGLTNDIPKLVRIIIDIYNWSKAQKRKSLIHCDDPIIPEIKLEQKFIDINTLIADKVQSHLGARFFGNFSTRCMKLFPCKREDEAYLFSPRNTDKKRISQDDFVLTTDTHYYGGRKPSVDAPVQIEVFKRFPNINYMIHGHATIPFAPETLQYYPCGSLLEVPEISELFSSGLRCINLKNHGFLIAAETLDGLEYIAKFCEFLPKDIIR